MCMGRTGWINRLALNAKFTIASDKNHFGRQKC